MFSWDEKYEWNFGDLGPSVSAGVNDAGINVFKRKPYAGLTKEIIQNSLDAAVSDNSASSPVRVCFELINVDRQDIPGANRLCDVIHKCADYYNTGDDGEKVKIIEKASQDYLASSSTVPVLKISDYDTTGLCGVKEERGSQWTGLIRESGATNKSGGASGSFGVGKFAPYNFSSIRTLFYTTYTVENEFAFQGKTILTTFKEDGKLKQNVGLFADSNDQNYYPVLNQEEVAPVFRRSEYGTDIFVIGFKPEKDWKELCAISVLENFLYAIYVGNLEVDVICPDSRIHISQKTLGDNIHKFEQIANELSSSVDGDDATTEDEQNREFTAPIYWNVLTNPNTKLFDEVFIFHNKKMGNYKLYMLTGEEASGYSVLQMRQAGMKIQELKYRKTSVNFNGIFIATGEGAKSELPVDNISSFLRKCENQAHTGWDADEYTEEKVKARGILFSIRGQILKIAKSSMPNVDKDSLDAIGLSQFLPKRDNNGDSKIEERAFGTYKPLSTQFKKNNIAISDSKVQISKETNGGSKRTGDTSTSVPTTRQNTPNNGRGKHAQKNSNIQLSHVAIPYISTSDEYRISFSIDEDVRVLLLGVKVGRDDGSSSKVKISEAYQENRKLQVVGGIIKLSNVNKDEKLILTVRLSSPGRKSLEVYANAEL